MQARKYEFCVTATYEEYYDIWAENAEEAREIFLEQSARYFPDEVKCLVKDRENADIINLAQIAG